MAEITEEEKYKRKAALLKRALAEADEMDAKDTAKSATAKKEKKNTDAKDTVPASQESTRPEAMLPGS